jgi:hypothetical protein
MIPIAKAREEGTVVGPFGAALLPRAALGLLAEGFAVAFGGGGDSSSSSSSSSSSRSSSSGSLMGRHPSAECLK